VIADLGSNTVARVGDQEITSRSHGPADLCAAEPVAGQGH
jgi:hypothetical protein